MNRKIKKLAVILLAAELIIVAAFGAAVYLLQSRLIADQKREELQAALQSFDVLLSQRAEELASYEEEYDNVLLSKADQAAFYLDHLGTAKPDGSVLARLADVMEVEEIHVMSADGEVLVSSGEPVIALTPEHIHAAGSNCKETLVDRSFRSYAAQLKNGSYVVIRIDAGDFTAVMDGISDELVFFSSTKLGFNGAVIAFDEVGNVLYLNGFDNVQEGENIFEKGLSRYDLGENRLKKLRIGNNYHFISFKWIEDGQTCVGFSIPQKMIDDQVIATVILLVFCFFSIITIFNIYIIFLYSQSLKDINREISRAAQKKEKVDINSLLKTYAKKLGRKVGVVVIIGTVIAFGLASYLQTMSMISIISHENQDNLNDFYARLEWNELNNYQLKAIVKKLLINKAMTAAYIIGQEPDVSNVEDLDELNTALDTEYVVIFDKDGKEAVSNGRFAGIEISENSEDPSYQLRSLMYGNSYVYTEPATGEYSGEVHQDIGASIRTEGEPDGFVVISCDQEDLGELYRFTDARNIFESTNLLVTKPLVIDRDSRTIIFAGSEIYEGKEALDYGINETEIRGNFCGYLTFHGSSYFASSIQRPDGSLIYLLTPRQVIEEDNVLFALIVCAMILIGLIMCAVINRCYVGKNLKKLVKGSIHVSKQEDEDGEDYPYVEVIMPDGSVKRAISVLGRFSMRDIEWDAISPEQKIATVIRVFVTILSLAALVVMIFKNWIFTTEGSIIRYILNMEWERNVNIFSLTYCALIICVIFMVFFILVKLMNRFVIVAGPKGETIIRMLKNFLKYISLIVGVCLCLSFIGVRVTTLLAGAGIITLIIGLGAQSLISDVINGLFIIFEGDFQVGDIVTIDDFRGTVQEVGIRTTKIMNVGGDLKIVRNSEMKQILNMTRQDSRCKCELLIEYREDLEKTIDTIVNEFDVIRANVPEIVNGPEFAGVSELSENGVKLLFIAYCNEKDRFACTYGINRQLKLICERNHINIPFPQVVVHDGDRPE